MNISSKRRRGLAFAAIMLIPFLCSFTEEGPQSNNYLERRLYEKILVEKFTKNEVSIGPDRSTIYTSKGQLTSFYEGNDLTRVSANLDGFSSPIDVGYHYAKDGSLDHYSNGHISLEKTINGAETSYIVDGDKALSIVEKDESIAFTYSDGETVWEEASQNGQFRVMRDSYTMFEGVDGPDGMLTSRSCYGLDENWDYDKDGNLYSYQASDKASYWKIPNKNSLMDVTINSSWGNDTYSVEEKDCRVTYSNKYGELVSDYNADASTKYISILSNGNKWNMKTSLRGDKPLAQVGEVSSPYAIYSAKFDDNNVVTEVIKDGLTERAYEYDGMNRLISSNDKFGGYSYYVYDDANNIVKAACANDQIKGDWFYNYKRNYLEALNDKELSYDKKGNITFFGKNSYNWKMGSLLMAAYLGDTKVSFEYDAMNNPISKNSDTNGKTRLIWEGRRLVAQADRKNLMSFLYDCFGSVIGFSYRDHFYVYCKNTLQDVVAIVRDDGKVVAEYSYGDYGEPGKVHDLDGSGIAFMNPFRYRSYYFDDELGLYHLRTRWYSPELRRFLSPDSPKVMLDKAYESELLLNRYSYCGNNPIAYVDTNGRFLTLSAAATATVLFFGVVIIGILLLPAIVSASKAHGMANGGYGTGTTITNPEPPTYQPVPSVEEPPAAEEPIVGEGGVSIPEQPIPNLDDYLKNATVIAGFALLEIALSMAHSSALVRIWRRYSHPTETHHIVPQNAVDRYHGWLPFIRLYMIGINPAGVNMGENTIVICTLLHKGLHNDAYYNGIATIFHYPTLTPLPEGSKPFMDLLKVVYGTIKATDETIRTLF